MLQGGIMKRIPDLKSNTGPKKPEDQIETGFKSPEDCEERVQKNSEHFEDPNLKSSENLDDTDPSLELFEPSSDEEDDIEDPVEDPEKDLVHDPMKGGGWSNVETSIRKPEPLAGRLPGKRCCIKGTQLI